MSGAIAGGAAITAIGGIVGSGKSKSASEKSSKAQMQQLIVQNEMNRQNAIIENQMGRDNADIMTGMNRENAQWYNNLNKQNSEIGNQMNRENVGFINDLNKGITDSNWQRSLDAMNMNRPEQVGADGSSVSWTTDAYGNPVQTSKLGAGSQGLFDQSQAMQSKMMGGLEGGFQENNSVMQAIRGLQDPGLRDREESEMARLAASGLMDSGRAYQNSLGNINKMFSDADMQAILGGNSAWLQSQDNMRKNMGIGQQSDQNVFSNFRGGMPGFSTVAPVAQGQVSGMQGVMTPTVSPVAHQVPTPGAQAFPSTGGIQNSANAAGQAAGSSWASIGGGLGNAFTSAMDSWNNRPQQYNNYAQNGGSVAPPGYYP